MLRRKAYEKLAEWKAHSTKQGLLVMGARQVGKTTLIREFARNNYDVLAEINFFDNIDAVETINAATDAQDLFFRITALSKTEIVLGHTLVFLDEIQECGDALTWLKFLEERTDLDYIFSGSLLGLDAFDTRSLPVGFLQTLTLYPLDFEEFCWAAGIGRDLTDRVRKSFAQKSKVPDFLHKTMMDAFYKYLLVGGMPEAVQAYADSDDLQRTRNVQQAIFDLYEFDIGKYVGNKTESRQIRMIYESIPGQLNSPNKRYKFTRLEKNLRFSNLETAFDWLKSSGVALAVSKVNDPIYPLGLSADVSKFKLYMNDVGLLTLRLMGTADIDILNKRSSINFGSVFENAIAQELFAQGFDLFYYNSKKLGEIDFLLQDNGGRIALCEVKSGKDYRRHSALNNMLSTKNYSFEQAYVFCEGNINVQGKIIYLPVYMAGVLNPKSFEP